ncbi:MAG: rhodanese-like domain-containing protein [Phycisphaeraceae bacterium]|nr:rhodanese-like domain-containing protein [Phycisphaeraceae bacterium]
MNAINLDDQGLPVGYRLKTDWEVTPRQVKDKLDKGEDLVFLDCRTAKEQQVAQIAGTMLIPLAELASRLLEIDGCRNRPVVIHCHHGQRSLQAATILRNSGFTNVKSMAGGIDLWSIDIDPSVPRY